MNRTEDRSVIASETKFEKRFVLDHNIDTGKVTNCQS